MRKNVWDPTIVTSPKMRELMLFFFLFSELFIELAKCTLPKPFVQYVSRLSSDFENIYDAYFRI